MKIAVHFDTQPVLYVCVDDTETGRIYFDLCRQQNTQQAPFYRDTMLYTPEYMIKLAQQAQQAFGWNWFSDHYDISNTVQLHKDLELSVGQLGFESVPEQYDMLLYDLHHCLHDIQSGKTAAARTGNFQIEWFTDSSAPLPNSFEFQEQSAEGDAILINPYVGHNPLQIYLEQDYSSLATTCRFHDRIKPGIVLTTQQHVLKSTVLEDFANQAPDFVELHGADRIHRYTGIARIGHVQDLSVLRHLKQAAQLTLDRVEFYD